MKLFAIAGALSLTAGALGFVSLYQPSSAAAETQQGNADEFFVASGDVPGQSCKKFTTSGTCNSAPAIEVSCSNGTVKKVICVWTSGSCDTDTVQSTYTADECHTSSRVEKKADAVAKDKSGDADLVDVCDASGFDQPCAVWEETSRDENGLTFSTWKAANNNAVGTGNSKVPAVCDANKHCVGTCPQGACSNHCSGITCNLGSSFGIPGFIED